MVKIIFSDLDGTLLNPGGLLDETTWNAVKTAMGEGVVFVPCSGRMERAIFRVFPEYTALRYVTALNGAEVYDRLENRCIIRSTFSSALAGEIIGLAHEMGAGCGCFRSGAVWLDAAALRNLSRQRQLAGQDPTLSPEDGYHAVEDLAEEITSANDPVSKITVSLPDPRLQPQALARFRAAFPQLAVTCSCGTNIELGSQEATKANALQALCRYLKVDIRESMALGDHHNDVEMLRIAGVGVAMGNAVPEAKEAADFVTDTNACQGAAKAILRFIGAGDRQL